MCILCSPEYKYSEPRKLNAREKREKLAPLAVPVSSARPGPAVVDMAQDDDSLPLFVDGGDLDSLRRHPWLGVGGR